MSSSTRGNKRSLTERLFRRDLKALLKKYDAELDIEQSDPYTAGRLNLYINAKFDDSGLVREAVDTILGTPCHGDDETLYSLPRRKP